MLEDQFRHFILQKFLIFDARVINRLADFGGVRNILSEILTALFQVCVNLTNIILQTVQFFSEFRVLLVKLIRRVNEFLLITLDSLLQQRRREILRAIFIEQRALLLDLLLQRVDFFFQFILSPARRSYRSGLIFFPDIQHFSRGDGWHVRHDGQAAENIGVFGNRRVEKEFDQCFGIRLLRRAERVIAFLQLLVRGRNEHPENDSGQNNKPNRPGHQRFQRLLQLLLGRFFLDGMMKRPARQVIKGFFNV